MLEFILKSGACMAIFLLFYKLLLEEENMHVFKRFYLLGSLVASLVIPLLVFTEYVEVTSTESNPIFIQQDTEDIINISPVLDADDIDFAPILWSIYFFGLFFFGLKFIRNLFQIFRRIRKNPKYKLNQFTQVLLQEKITPHTFFSYIFLNKTKFESKQIPKEVLLHEQTHASQKHSWDVLFVELLQVIFWVNPLIYLVKKAIKLNHEFLADQAVLQKNIDETTYKNTLLSYVSPDSEKKYQPLANAINYSSIKKRFTIMKTHTSKKAIFLRTLLLLPLIVVLLYGFSETKIIEETTSQSVEKIAPVLEKQKLTIDNDQVQIVEELVININKKGKLLIFNQIVVIEELPSFLSNYLSDVTENELQKTLKATIRYDLRSPQNVIDKVKNILRENNIVKLNMEKLNFLENTNDQNSASKKQLAEYNALAKKYNTMLSKSSSVQIKMKDVERLEYIYNLMSDKQKANAEAFPNFPPMPELPTPPKAPKVKKGEKSNIPQPPPSTPNNEETKLVKQEAKLIEQEILIKKEASKLKEIEPLTPHVDSKNNNPQLESTGLITGAKSSTTLTSSVSIDAFHAAYSPTVPPNPISPLDHVVKMAKKDARFFYEGKEISSDKAIDILKKNKSINIDTRNSNGSKPTVRLSKKAIKVTQVKNSHSSYEYALELNEKDAQFYFEDEPIDAIVGIEILKSRKDLIVETYPWVSKNPEVKIYEKS